MANVAFNAGKAWVDNNGVSGATFKAVLLMSNTTVFSDGPDVDTLNDFTTIDEFDGTGYTTGGETLSGVAATAVDASDKSMIDATDLTGLSLTNGTRQVAGVLVMIFVSSFSSSIPYCAYDKTSSPVDGEDLNGVQVNVNGLYRH